MFQNQLLRMSQLSLLACACLPAFAATYSIQGNTYIPGPVTETVTATFTYSHRRNHQE